MGYYASGYGEFVLVDQEMTYDDLVARLGKDLVEDYGLKIEYDKYFYKANVLIYDHTECKYWEDDVVALLGCIAPLVAEGSVMEFRGEDDEHWKFELKDGKWIEYSGTITYDDPFLLRMLLDRAVYWIRQQEDDDEVFRQVLQNDLEMTDEEVERYM